MRLNLRWIRKAEPAIKAQFGVPVSVCKMPLRLILSERYHMQNRPYKGMARVFNSIRWRLRRAFFLARYEWFRSPPFMMSYQGFNIEYGRGDVLVHLYSVKACYEPHVISYVQSNLEPGATVVDIGANVGFFSLAVLALIPGSTVHMFEPSPVSRGHLAQSIAKNSLESRVRLNPYALYSEPGEMDFCVHPEKYAAFDGLRDTRSVKDSTPIHIKVPVTTLDIYLTQAGVKHLDLVKIDVEGAEMFVLQGAEDTLKELRPRVLFEVGQQNLDPYGLRPEHIYGFFQEHGYRMQDIQGQPLSEAEFRHRSTLEHEFVAVPGI